MVENASKLERKPDELHHAGDTELLRRYAEDGSEAAFAELVSRHVGLVYAAALRQVGGVAHRAQDVAQTVFVALARQAAPLSRRREIVGWLYTSTHHVAAKLKRTEQRRVQREQEAHAMNEINADDRAAADWDRLRPVLDAAMHGLNDADREAILLRYFQDLRLAAIGRRLGLSEDAARMRVERALDKLQALLERRGITSTTAALGVALANPALADAPAGLAATVTGAALAGVATSTGAAVTAAAVLMNTKTTLATVAAVLALGFAVYEFKASRREREIAAGLADERDALQGQLREARARALAAEVKSAGLQGELAAVRPAQPVFTLKPAPADSSAPPNAGGGTVTPDSSFYLGSMTREQARANKGRNLDTGYATLYRDLNLTPVQREQFKNLMLDIEEASAQLFGKAVAEAKARNPKFDRADQFEVFEALGAQTQADQVAAVRQAFGESAAQALQNYQATASMRYVVKQLAGNLFNSEAPLQPAQADQLIEIMARNARGPAGKVELVALNVEAAVAQAGGVLSPTQLAELRKTAEIALAQAKLERERNTAPAASLRRQ